MKQLNTQEPKQMNKIIMLILKEESIFSLVKNVKCCEYGGYMVGANGYCVYGEKECAE